MKTTFTVLSFIVTVNLFAQGTFSNMGVVYVGENTQLSVRNYVHLSNSGLQIEEGGELLLFGELSNQTVTSITEGYTGKIVFNGNTQQKITSRFAQALFHDVVINNPSGVVLNGNVAVARNLVLENGVFQLDGFALELKSLPAVSIAKPAKAGLIVGESTDQQVIGNGTVLTGKRNFSGAELASFVNVGNIGAAVKLAAGVDVDVSMERRHVRQSANANHESILRTYDVKVTHHNSETPFISVPAALRFYYLDTDMDEIAAEESRFALFKSVDNGVTWINQGGVVNEAENYVELAGINDLNGLWTVSYCVAPTVSLGDDRELCPDAPASLTADVTGFAPFSYRWSMDGNVVAEANAPVFDLASPDAAALYSVEVTDANGCIASDEVATTIRDLPTIGIASEFQVCENESAMMDAGVAFDSYTWSYANAVVGNDRVLEASAAGEYTLLVSDEAGCINSAAITLIHKPVPTNSLPSESVTCGDEILIGSTLQADNPGAMFTWRDAGANIVSTQPEAIVSESGIYTVSIQGANGCSVEAVTNVTLNRVDFFTLGEDQTVCAQSTVVLNAERPNSSYLWSTGETTGTINLPVGSDQTTIWVELTDLTSNCKSRDELVINVRLLPQIDLADEVKVCEGTTTLLDAGSGFAMYRWNDQSTGQTLEVTEPGTYTVEVTDTQGCANTKQVAFGFYSPINISLPAETVTCGTEALVGVDLDVNNPGATFLWSTGATTPTITVNEAGSYAVTVTDMHGCEASGNTVVTLNDPDFVDLGPDISMACTAVTIDAGNPGANYQWSDGTTQRLLVVDKPGTYSVTVSNAMGCVDSDDVNVTLLPQEDEAFFLSATEAMVNDTLYFIGLTTTPTMRTEWDFKDGTRLEGNETVVSHIYMSGGEYDPALVTVFENGCTDEYSKRITITAIEEDESNGGRTQVTTERLIRDVVVYPNPNDGRFEVDVSLSTPVPMSIMIVNSMGMIADTRQVDGKDFYSLSYDLRHLRTDVYVLVVRAGKESKQFRLLIQPGSY